MSTPTPPNDWNGQAQPPAHPSPGAPNPGVSQQTHQDAKNLSDGEWHRMHPLTPLLRGGLTLLVFIGVLIAWGRDRIIGWFFPDAYGYYEDDPITMLLESGWLIAAIAAVVVILILCVVGFYVSYRMRTFRITGDVVELREGILNRKHRRAPLGRIQSIEMQKPWLARIFGLAKLEIEQASSDGKVELSFLKADLATALRGEILHRASGRKREEGQATPQGQMAPQGHTGGFSQQPGAHAGFVGGVRNEFLNPEADLQQQEHQLVSMHAGRLIASSFLNFLPWAVFLTIAIIVIVVATGEWLILLGFVPTAIITVVAVFGQLIGQLRFSVASTVNGIRVSRGLASVTSETIPPGRIFSITVTQPMMWRPFGWWKVSYGRATMPTASSSGNSQASLGTVLLPVGNRADVEAILRLVISPDRVPFVMHEALEGSRGIEAGFITSPKRARAFRWFSLKRNGMHANDELFVLRKGRIWRTVNIVPAARVQSVSISQGPIYGLAKLARVQFHTVGLLGLMSLGAMDQNDVNVIFGHANTTVRGAMVSDKSETWGSDGEAAKPAFDGPPPSPAYAVAPETLQHLQPPAGPPMGARIVQTGPPAHPSASQPPQADPNRWTQFSPGAQQTGGQFGDQQSDYQDGR